MLLLMLLLISDESKKMNSFLHQSSEF